MDNSARFCPYCGAENLEAKAAAPAGKPVSMPSLSLGGNANVPRIVLMVLSALQVLLFFTLSHGSVRLLSALNSIFGSEFSDKLTAYVVTAAQIAAAALCMVTSKRTAQ